jgi:hypothetical protein
VIVDRSIFVRQAQHLTEQTVKVGSQLH